MLGWLTLIVAALAGLLLFTSQSGYAVDSLPAWLVVGVTAALLGGLYLAAYRQRSREERNVGLLFGILAFAILAAAVWWFGGTYFSAAKDSAEAQRALGQAGNVSVLIRRDSVGAFVAQGQINQLDAHAAE